jgi:ferritin-like metal-binding protein YciE
MAKAAQSEELKAAFEKHRGETGGQIERLEQVFAIVGEKPRGKNRWREAAGKDLRRHHRHY